ncbi:MAG: JAB domain-containing protein, partial [Candidatus Moranbacteria bacterium]|nr:JAB domain-containing protein [Candidatus Moranbacteria bacterium]
MMKIKDIAKIDRPREILEKYGPEKLSDAQLLAILLRTGTKDCNVIELSKKILKKFPNEKLLSATIE